MTEFSIENLLSDPLARAEARRLLDAVNASIEESKINYRFMWQMLGEDNELPTDEVLTLIIANGYRQALLHWSPEDVWLPTVFAALTVREVLSRDR